MFTNKHINPRIDCQSLRSISYLEEINCNCSETLSAPVLNLQGSWASDKTRQNKKTNNSSPRVWENICCELQGFYQSEVPLREEMCRLCPQNYGITTKPNDPSHRSVCDDCRMSCLPNSFVWFFFSNSWFVCNFLQPWLDKTSQSVWLSIKIHFSSDWIKHHQTGGLRGMFK